MFKEQWLRAEASLLKTQRPVTKAEKNLVQSWLTKACVQGLFPLFRNGSEFGPVALVIYINALSLLTLLKWKRSSGKLRMKTIISVIFPLLQRLSHRF